VAPFSAMEPVAEILAPFVPLGLLVAALVSFVRTRLARAGVKVDGWGVVGMAAGATVAVCLWIQQRQLGAFDWRKLLIEAPAVFVLAVGGTALVKQLKEQDVVVAPLPAKETDTDAVPDPDEASMPPVTRREREL
jgi:hypothetical protein